MRLLRLGDRGSAVAEVKALLRQLEVLDTPAEPTDPDAFALDPDTIVFDPDTIVFDEATDQAVRAFQQQRGLLVDGIVGPATYRVLLEASYRLGTRILLYRLSAPMQGDDVATLQARLQNLGYYTALVDGTFNEATHAALCAYQSEFGLNPDGICGPATLRSLQLLGTRVSGGSPHAIREEENVRRSGPQLSGKRIIIDPGNGGNHQYSTGALAQLESDVLWDLCARLEGRMAAAGMETSLSRAADQNPDNAERAAGANSIDADLMISFRCAHYHNNLANGVSTFYFGSQHGSASAIGQSLAGFIDREIVARTPLRDCRSHRRTWDLLRLTRMPIAQIDVGYITNEHDAEALSDPRVRDAIAEATLVAVKRLYLLGKNDQPTGTYTFAELLAAEQLAR